MIYKRSQALLTNLTLLKSHIPKQCGLIYHAKTTSSMFIIGMITFLCEDPAYYCPQMLLSLERNERQVVIMTGLL